ncbi:MAG: hypothetical protein GKR89_16245 [Candidatus Latescibacteria bacterium]|nr:hypothetical protein [Candidatus Latescibacterota bacterium]
MQAFLADDSGNPSAQHYQVSEGYPAFAPKARFLGTLAGSWFDIGFQVGSQAGDLVRWVADIWWRDHVEEFGLDDTRKALPLYEEQIAALDEGLIQFMQGVAQGADRELRASPYAQACSPYHKVLNTNIYDAWSWRHPTHLPWKKDPAQGPGCSSFASLGTGPNAAEMIAAHNRHCPLNPKCYQLSYMGQPTGGHAFWVLTPGGAGSGCQIVNARGVSIILNAGGDQHRQMGANAFGVSWFLLFLHVAAQANSAAEAIAMLTEGTPQYRANTGRNSLLRTGTWNFLVSDRRECAVVETSCDRYAIRRPGDMGELGNYLVMTNHNYCDHSFDWDNQCTDLPMTRFGNEETNPGSAVRFWTLMGDLRHNYGQLDRRRAMEIMCGHHQHDRQGLRLEAVAGEPGLHYGGDVTCPHSGGYPDVWKFGSADSKVAVHGEDLRVYWTLGRPCEWQGAWDEVLLDG